ncbi:hypothetical protein WN982_09505 [Paraburkholderia sp. IMGN_8]
MDTLIGTMATVVLPPVSAIAPTFARPTRGAPISARSAPAYATADSR